MTRRVRLAAIALSVVVLLAVCLLFFRRDDGPVYNGKRLSVWLDEQIPRSDGTRVLSDEAIDAVQKLGPAVIPQLLNWLQRTDLPGFQHLRYGAGIPVPLNDVWRTRALYGFRALGDRGAAAIPEFVSLALRATDEDVRRAAINALTNGHPEIDRLLAQALRDPDVQLRRRAVFALACLRPVAGIKLLTSALSDTDSQVRREAAEGLGIYSTPLLPQSAIKALRPLLSDPDGEVRSAAQFAIDRQIEYRKNGMAAAAVKE